MQLNRRKFRQWAWPLAFLAFCAVSLFHVSSGHAQTVGAFDNLVNLFKNRVAGMEGTIRTAAQELFLALIGIEIVIYAARFIGNKDWVELFSGLVWLMVRVGIFWYALMHWPDFSMAIVNSFGQVGNNASVAAGGSTNLMPSGIFASGANVASAVWSGFRITDPAMSLLLAISGIAVIVVYAIITALMIEVLVESYLVAYAGLLLMGFGGTRYTQSFAEAQFRYAISVGVKRFLLQLIIGISEGLMQDLSRQTFGGSTQATWTALVAIIGVPIVLLTLAHKIPYKAQDMINGVSSHGAGGIIASAAAIAAGAVAGGAALFGSAAAASSAVKLATQQVTGGGGGGGGGESQGGGGSAGGESPGAASRMAGGAMTGAKITGYAVGNLAKAAASDVGKRMTGSYAATHGQMGMRMSSDMARRRASLSGDANS